jgi:ATP-dependent RNA helicase DHX57
LLTDVNAYDAVAALRKTGGQSAVRNFCERVGTAESTGLANIGTDRIASQVVASPLTLALLQNFISASTIRDITSLRQDFLSALSQIGFLDSSASSLDRFSTNKGIDSLVKSVVVGGLYPRIARIATPEAMFKQIHAGTVQKDVSGVGESPSTVSFVLRPVSFGVHVHVAGEYADSGLFSLQHEAKELKLYDQSGRVFIHPSSILFSEAGFKSGFLAYFAKAETSKVFLRDATEVGPSELKGERGEMFDFIRPIHLKRRRASSFAHRPLSTGSLPFLSVLRLAFL